VKTKTLTLEERADLLARAIADFSKALMPLGGDPDAGPPGGALAVELSIAPGPYIFDDTQMKLLRERLTAALLAKPKTNKQMDSIGGVRHETEYKIIGMICAPPCPLAFHVSLTHPVSYEDSDKVRKATNAALKEIE
jgi:hypothetical protein